MSILSFVSVHNRFTLVGPASRVERLLNSPPSSDTSHWHIPRGRQRAILAHEISWFLFDFPVISLKNDVICCKSGWGWRVGLISELDFKEICFDFSWFQLDFNWFLHEVYKISFVANPSSLPTLIIPACRPHYAEARPQSGRIHNTYMYSRFGTAAWKVQSSRTDTLHGARSHHLITAWPELQELPQRAFPSW